MLQFALHISFQCAVAMTKLMLTLVINSIFVVIELSVNYRNCVTVCVKKVGWRMADRVFDIKRYFVVLHQCSYVFASVLSG